MSDLISLAVISGFFAAAVGLLRACEHIIGPDPLPSTTEAPIASAPATPDTDPIEVTGMSADNLIGLLLAVAVLGYLVFALVFPERF